MKLLIIDDKTSAVDRVQSSLGMISLEKEEHTKNPSTSFYHLSNPPSVPSSATVGFPAEWVLVRDANVFMGDVPLEYC